MCRTIGRSRGCVGLEGKEKWRSLYCSVVSHHNGRIPFYKGNCRWFATLARQEEHFFFPVVRSKFWRTETLNSFSATLSVGSVVKNGTFTPSGSVGLLAWGTMTPLPWSGSRERECVDRLGFRSALSLSTGRKAAICPDVSAFWPFFVRLPLISTLHGRVCVIE